MIAELNTELTHRLRIVERGILLLCHFPHLHKSVFYTIQVCFQYSNFTSGMLTSCDKVYIMIYAKNNKDGAFHLIFFTSR